MCGKPALSVVTECKCHVEVDCKEHAACVLVVFVYSAVNAFSYLFIYLESKHRLQHCLLARLVDTALKGSAALSSISGHYWPEEPLSRSSFHHYTASAQL